MQVVNRLLYGTHPKTGRIKERTVQIVKVLKNNNGRIEAKQLEEALGISRLQRPAMFYKPLHFMRKWGMIRVHKNVLFDERGKKRFQTIYEYTPHMFYQYIQRTLFELVKRELDTV